MSLGGLLRKKKRVAPGNDISTKRLSENRIATTVCNTTNLNRIKMDPPQKSQAALFKVYLRLRPAPPPNQLYPSLANERFITVEEANNDELPTHITLNPPNDNRRRAVEKFAFTKIFEEDANQLDLFQGTGVLPLVEGVLGPLGGEGRDGLLATLGVTGSGKVFMIYDRLKRNSLIAADAHHPRFSLNSRLDPTRP